MIDIRDVPCLGCQRKYDGPHECDVPDWCPCDRRHLHTNDEEKK